MSNLGPTEILLIGLVGWMVPLVAAYWIIRLAVRHGVMDAHRRLPGTDRAIAPTEPTGSSRSVM